MGGRGGRGVLNLGLDGGETVELQSSGLQVIGTASHPVMQKIRIIESFFEKRLQWQFEVEKSFYKRMF